MATRTTAVLKGQFWGIDPAQLHNEPQGDGVWPENIEAVRGFLSVCNQWRVIPLGMAGAQMMGLDYTAARNGLEMMGMTITPGLWAQIQMVETGALAAMKGG